MGIFNTERTDYIQPKPIKAPFRLGEDIPFVNKVVGDRRKPFGDVTSNRQQKLEQLKTTTDKQARNIAQQLGAIPGGVAGIGKEIYNQGALPLMQRSGDYIYEQGIKPAMQGYGNQLGFVRNLLLGRDNQPTQGVEAKPGNINPQLVNQGNNQMTVGSQQARDKHKEILEQYKNRQITDSQHPLSIAPQGLKNYSPSLAPLAEGETEEYRNAFITDNNKLDSEGDSLGVSLGSIGSVSGLTPEQAQRIQKSLAEGRQAGSFNTQNMINSSRSDTDGKIMQALGSGQINADKADALMNRDFRASDRMDRLGGGAEAYYKMPQQPKTIEEAVTYGSDIRNFTNNGELSNQEALLAQRNYLGTLGGRHGVAGRVDTKRKPVKYAFTRDEVIDKFAGQPKEVIDMISSIPEISMNELREELGTSNRDNALAIFMSKTNLPLDVIEKMLYTSSLGA